MKKKLVLLTTVSMSLEFFREQISELSKIYDVTLVSSPSEELIEIASREGVAYKAIKMKREISFFHDLRSFIKLLYYFITRKIFIIHCNTPKASLLGLVAGKIVGIPNRIYYVHGLRFEGAFGIKRKILIGLEILGCYCATEIIAVSYGIKEKVERNLTNKKVIVIDNGSANGVAVDEFINCSYDSYQIKEGLGIEHDDFLYGYVGRIVSDKGINELIYAFNEINNTETNTKLLLVGSYEDKLDPLLPKTKKIISENTAIIETGFQKDVKKYLSIMDVFVSPSYREGFGLSLLEANLMGKPVIATQITGYDEIIRENINGFLVPAKDSTALLNRMKFVLNNKNFIRDMKQSCIQEVSEKYSHKKVMQSALGYYSKFLR
ncbi:capsular biosynthesis protein [Flavobacterium psychrophilum]|nr:capsular biosynthesis protein [Flavobacterium psychrophilum]AOE54123.1 capsular biosynthesis protein [Flavobacterium psychrophilum]